MRDATFLIAVGLALSACQDNEQRARALGADARDAVAKRCTADGSADEQAACTDERCRVECASRDVPPGFGSVCLDTCRQTAICATSADCGAGKECVAVAPVVRRCIDKATAP